LIPTVTEGFYNLQEEMDNIMISNTAQDFEIVQLQSGLSATNGYLTTVAALAGTANINALAAGSLADQKSWILFFQKPLSTDISSKVYLNYDTNYFSVDASNNLTLNTNFWKKDISNNISLSYNKVGINTTTPQGALEVVWYINTYRIKFGTILSTGTVYRANRIYSNGLFRFLSAYYTDEIATFHRIDNYDDPINAMVYFSIKTSGVNVTGNISATGTITTTGGTINGT
jgi:hypothetical protein